MTSYCSVCLCKDDAWTQVYPIDNDLKNTWKISNTMARLFNRREGLYCVSCECNVRTMGLAYAIKTVYGIPNNQDFQAWVKYANNRKLSVAEINGCHRLHSQLERLRGLKYSEYNPNRAPNDPPHEDILNLSYKGKSFDLVLHSETLEHVPDPKRALNECLRVLKPNGVLIFTIPVIWSRKSIQRTRINASGELTYLMPKSFHGYGRPDCLVWFEYGLDALDMFKPTRILRDPKNQNYIFIIEKKNQRDWGRVSRLGLVLSELLAICLNILKK